MVEPVCPSRTDLNIESQAQRRQGLHRLKSSSHIGSAGVAEWATDLTPTTPANTKAAHFIQAANSVAWNDSQWGVLGSFPKNYPSPPAVPSLDDPAFDGAAACLG